MIISELKTFNDFAISRNLATFALSKDKRNIINNLIFRLMDIDIILNTLERIVKNNSNKVNLFKDVEYPDSELVFENNELIWFRNISTEYAEDLNVNELDDDELEELLFLLLSNGIISQNTYIDWK